MRPEIDAAAAFVAQAGAEFEFKVLSADEVRDLEAIADQILPGDGTPGAVDAGAVRFMDHALETFMQGALEGFRGGLQAMNRTVQEAHPESTHFADLTPDRQASLIEDAEATPFFGLVRFLTIAGTFSHPSYGGNREKLGWRLLGFDDRHVWQPPFGAYEEE